MRISGPRGPVLAVVTLLVVLAVAAVAVAVVRDPAPPAGTTPAAPTVTVAPAARSVPVALAVGSLAVLRDWDRARARAWAAGDVPALRRLYLPGSAAGAADVAMLRSWLRRGLRVTGMSMQVVAVELRRRSLRRIVLVVTDRLVGAVAGSGAGGVRELPRDAETTRRLDLRKVRGRWLLASAQEVGRAPDRPAASTAATSGSANE